jgi:hypothetical protein
VIKILQMSLAETQPALLQAPVLVSGDIALRYAFQAVSGSEEYDATVVLGVVNGEAAIYDDEISAFVALVDSAAQIKIQDSYFQTQSSPVVVKKIRDGTDFRYDTQMRLSNLVNTSEEAEAAVFQLMDNESFKRADMAWEASVVGLSALRIMQRALFVASSSDELNQPAISRERTHPEIRADVMNYLASRALDTVLVMPPKAF